MGDKVDPMQNLDPLARRVGKVDVLKPHLALEPGQCGWRCGAKAGFHFPSFAEEFPNSLRAPEVFLDLTVYLRKLPHRPRHKGRIEAKTGKFAESNLSL